MLKFPYSSLGHAQRWLACREIGGLEVPAFAVLEVFACDSDGTFQVRQMTAVGTHGRVVFNGPTIIPANGFGQVTRDYPCLCLTSDDTEGFADAFEGSYTMANGPLATGFWSVVGVIVPGTPAISLVCLGE